MRAPGAMLAVALTATFAAGGCSLLFDGNDLRGKSGGGDMGAGGSGGGGGGDVDMAGGGGTGGTGGGGGTTGSCTPLSGDVKFTVKTPSVAATSPFYIAIADFDQDGKIDIATSNYNSNNISVLLGSGDGNFNLASTSPMATCSSPLELVARDVNGDTKPDLIVACWDTTTAAVNVHLNQSTPGMIKFSTQPVTVPAQKRFFPVVGNFNDGTKPDLALVGNDNVYIYLGDGAGGFAPSITVPTGKGCQSAVAGNLNGDAIDDLVTFNDGDDDMTMLLSKTGMSGYNTTPLAWDTTGTPHGTLYFGSTPVLLDLDGDSLQDIVIASGTSVPGTIEIFKNGGTATAPVFPVNGQSISVGDIPLNVTMADLNCDGKLDIASASSGCEQATQGCTGSVDQPPQLWVLPGHGTGFDARQTTAVPAYCDNIVAYDFDGNGYLDLACGSGGGSINVLLNTP